MLITMLCFSRYRIAAKYSNKRVFQHWCKEGCRTTSWKDLMPQRAHDEGASNATFRWRVWCHLAKLHVCEVCKAFEYLEVIRYSRIKVSQKCWIRFWKETHWCAASFYVSKRMNVFYSMTGEVVPFVSVWTIASLQWRIQNWTSHTALGCTALFKVMCWLGHPENRVFVLWKVIFIGSKNPENVWLNFEDKITGAQWPHGSEGLPVILFPRLPMYVFQYVYIF